MHRAVVILRPTEIRHRIAFLIPRDVHRVVNQLVDPFVQGRGNRHHRDPEHFFHPVDVHRTAVAPHFVHHVQRQHHRHVQLHELKSQVQIALQIRCVGDVDDALRLLLQNIFPGDHFLLCVGRKGVNPRQVRHLSAGLSADDAGALVDRHPREIPDVLVCAGELVEQRRLAAVLIACQREGQNLVLRQRPALVGFRVVETHTRFTVARVLDMGRRLFRLHLFRLRQIRDCNLCRLGYAEGQHVVVDFKFHRVAHRGVLN